jgi:hypothetical protein
VVTYNLCACRHCITLMLTIITTLQQAKASVCTYSHKSTVELEAHAGKERSYSYKRTVCEHWAVSADDCPTCVV